jgi:hypothetical protein
MRDLEGTRYWYGTTIVVVVALGVCSCTRVKHKLINNLYDIKYSATSRRHLFNHLTIKSTISDTIVVKRQLRGHWNLGANRIYETSNSSKAAIRKWFTLY